MENKGSPLEVTINNWGTWITGTDPLWIFVLLSTVIILGMLLINALKHRRRKRQYTILKNRRNMLWNMTRRLKKNRFLHKILDNIAIKLSMFNSYSYEKNLEYALVFCICAFITAWLVLLIFLPSIKTAWYLTVFYIFLAVSFVMIALMIFTAMARMSFTAKMPRTYTLIRSRFADTGDVLEAIEHCKDDFDKTVKREMIKVSNLFKRNDMQDIANTLQRMERTYKNQYFTILLTLIYQAKYKGNNEVVKELFEETTEEILSAIEDQKDLSMTARTYMLLSLTLLGMLKGFESFNYTALGEKSLAFFASPLGIQMKIGFIILYLIYIGTLLFMEKSA